VTVKFNELDVFHNDIIDSDQRSDTIYYAWLLAIIVTVLSYIDVMMLLLELARLTGIIGSFSVVKSVNFMK